MAGSKKVNPRSKSNKPSPKPQIEVAPKRPRTRNDTRSKAATEDASKDELQPRKRPRSKNAKSQPVLTEVKEAVLPEHTNKGKRSKASCKRVCGTSNEALEVGNKSPNPADKELPAPLPDEIIEGIIRELSDEDDADGSNDIDRSVGGDSLVQSNDNQNVENANVEKGDGVNEDQVGDESEVNKNVEDGDEGESENNVVSEDDESSSLEEANGEWRLVRPVDGGPEDISLLTSYRGHVAFQIWNNNERDPIHCQSRFKQLQKWELKGGWAEIVEDKDFGHLAGCTFKHLNVPLIAAFVEKWHPETNSFHFQWGEISITLHDVAYLLGLRIDGKAVHDDKLELKSSSEGKSKMDLMKESISKCLHISVEDLKKMPKTIKGCAIKIQSVKELSELCKDDEDKARAYLFGILGAINLLIT